MPRSATSTAAESAASLRNARHVWAARAGRPPLADKTYTLYVTALFALIWGIPVVRTLVIWLMRDDTLVRLASPGVGSILAAGLGTLLLGAVVLGTVRGPLVLSPFLVQFLVFSPLPQRLTLRRRMRGTLIGCATGTVVLAAITLSALTAAGAMHAGSAVAVGVGMLAYSVLVAVAWLLGQRGGRLRASVLTAGVLLLAAPLLGVPAGLVTPWGWVGMLWQRATSDAPDALSTLWSLSPLWSLWPLAALLALALTALAVMPRLLDALPEWALLGQARTWHRVGIAGASGDLSTAAGVLRPLPRRGRRLHLPMRGGMAATLISNDALTLLRYPARLATGALATATGAALVAAGVVIGEGTGGALAAVGTLTAYAASGVFLDGARHVINLASGPALYGPSTGVLLGWHAVVPVLATAILGSAGIVLLSGVTLSGAGLSGAGLSGLTITWLTWFTWLTLVAALVATRLMDAAKGPMPLALQSPIPTAFGDLSAAVIFAWQSDALLIAAALGVLAALAPPASAALGLAAVALIVTLNAARRVRMLSVHL